MNAQLFQKVRNMVNNHSKTINEIVNVVNDMSRRVNKLEGNKRKPDITDVEYRVIEPDEKKIDEQK